MKLFVIAMLCTSPLFAQDQIPLKFSIEEEAGPIFEKVLTKDQLNRVIGLLDKYKPEANNIFQWDPQTPRRKSIQKVEITFTTRNDLRFNQHITESNFPNESALDKSATTILWSEINPASKVADHTKQTIEVFVFLDRVFLHSNGTIRIDGITRLIGILAHEMFGNVTKFLHIETDKDVESHLHRINIEINAFQAGIDFLERLINDLKQNTSENAFIDGLQNNLNEQIMMQAQWIQIRDSLLSPIHQNQNKFFISDSADLELINIYNLNGEPIDTDRLYNENTRTLNTNLLPKGTYIVHIRVANPDQETIKRIVIF